MAGEKPEFDCPKCDVADWDWFEYWELTGWRCGSCQDIIVEDTLASQ